MIILYELYFDLIIEVTHKEIVKEKRRETVSIPRDCTCYTIDRRR